MERFRVWFDHVDTRITSFMARYSITILRISLGVIFFWFGILKFFAGLSPAEALAGRTIERLTFGLISPETAVIILAGWESLIGIGLIWGRFLRATLLVLFLQMIGTMTPLILFPSDTFTQFPYAATLEGQYIIKNLVLIAAGLVVGATVRGASITQQGQVGVASPKRIM